MARLKTTVSVLLIAALATLLILQQNSVDRLRAKVVALEGQDQQLKKLRAEVDRLKSETVGAAELTRLRKADVELMRLRNEKGRSLHTRVQPAEKGTNAASQANAALDNGLQSFKAKIQAHLGDNQTLVMGGWLSDDGKRYLVFVTPKPVEDAQILYTYQVVSAPDEAMASLGLSGLRADGTESSAQRMLTQQEEEALMASLEANPDVEVLEAPRTTTKENMPAMISVGDSVTLPGSSEPVVVGPVITLQGKRGDDGASFDIDIDAQLNMSRSTK